MTTTKTFSHLLLLFLMFLTFPLAVPPPIGLGRAGSAHCVIGPRGVINNWRTIEGPAGVRHRRAFSSCTISVL